MLSLPACPAAPGRLPAPELARKAPALTRGLGRASRRQRRPWLLVRRHPSTGEQARYLCWADRPQPLATLIGVAGRRQVIEETFQTAKSQLELYHHQVRRQTSWHRFITLVTVALAFLAVAASQTLGPDPDTDAPSPESTPAPREQRCLVPVTLAELRHLLAGLLPRPALDDAYLLA